jgi:hypothetical protein
VFLYPLKNKKASAEEQMLYFFKSSYQIISFLYERVSSRAKSSTSSFIESNLSVMESTRSLNLFFKSLPLFEMVSRVSDPFAGAKRIPVSNPAQKPTSNLFITIILKVKRISFSNLPKYHATLQKIVAAAFL